MNTLVIYDSLYGNTEKVARSIGKALSAQVLQMNEVKFDSLNTYDLVVVGSPTQGGRPTSSLHSFLKKLPKGSLQNVKFATFDTRFEIKDQKTPLKILMKLIDYAAPKIAKTLEAKGGKLIGSPEGFIVEGKEGPLKKGELNRAAVWARCKILI